MNIIKCACSTCNSTGIEKNCSELQGLGIICRECNGHGYINLEVSNNIKTHEVEGLIFLIKNKDDFDYVKKFTARKRRYDIRYVTYATNTKLTPEYLFEHGASEINVITYKEFIDNIIPLPMVRYHCPKQLSDNYSNNDINFDCSDKNYCNCSTSHKFECLTSFYRTSKAKTIKEKQSLMKKKVLKPVTKEWLP